MRAAVFCEDDFDSIHDVADEAEFSAFSDGFDAGAKAYGGGKWRLYLLPRDSQKMYDDEHVGEIMRAHEAIEAAQSPEIQSPITDAAIDPAKPDLLGRRVRVTRNPEHDRLFDPLHRAALDGTVAKVDAQDATGAYHVTSDDETQWGWFRPDELRPE